MFDNLEVSIGGHIGSGHVYGLFNEWVLVYKIDWRSGLTEVWLASGGKMLWQQFGAAF
jgi:hypothetical protein